MTKPIDAIQEKKRARRRGEGSIVHRPATNDYVARISGGFGENGRRIRYNRVTKTFDEAVLALAQMRVDIAKGALAPGASRKNTLRALIESYLADLKESKRVTTHSDARIVADLHVLPYLGDRQVPRLTPKIIHDHIRVTLVKAGVGNRTRLKAHTLLRAAFEHGRPLDLCGANPMRDLKRPKYEAAEMQPLDAKQAAKLVKAIRGDRYEAFYLLLLFGGLRPGEAMGLTRGDLDLPGRRLHVRRTVENVTRPKLSRFPKTKASIRTISLAPGIVDALRAHLERTEGDVVFQAPGGGLIRRQNFARRMWGPLLERAGLPKIRLYDLRHTSATLDHEMGTPPKLIQERLGHRSIRTTLDTYTKTFDGMGQAAADRFAEPFLGSGTASEAEG